MRPCGALAVVLLVCVVRRVSCDVSCPVRPRDSDEGSEQCSCLMGGLKNMISCSGLSLKNLPFFGHNKMIFDHIDLSMNSLKSLPSRAFGELQVRSIELSHGGKLGDRVSSQAFSGPLRKEVVMIQLAQCGIEQLHQDTFKGLTKLNILNLNTNHLKSIPKNLFFKLNLLQTLDLRSNRLTEIVSGTFLSLPSLEKLFLSGNRLISIQDSAFHNLPRLTNLFLSKNSLPVVTRRMFQMRNNITELDLHGNNISRIACHAFDSLKMVKEVRLSDNKLTSIPHCVFGKLPKQTTAQVKHNALLCECRDLSWLLDSHHARIHAHCFHPTDYFNKSVHEFVKGYCYRKTTLSLGPPYQNDVEYKVTDYSRADDTTKDKAGAFRVSTAVVLSLLITCCSFYVTF